MSNTINIVQPKAEDGVTEVSFVTRTNSIFKSDGTPLGDSMDAYMDEVDELSQNLTIKSKTFNVNTGGASQVTFEMDDAEQMPIHVKSGSNDIFSLAERTGIRWKFSVARLTLETSVHNGYFYEALFNKDITITVYYIC